MNVDDLIMEMVNEALKEDCATKESVIISVEALKGFVKLFGLHAIHDNSIQQELMEEV